MRNYVYPIMVVALLAAPGCSGHNGVTASAGVEKNISEESEAAPVLSAAESSSGSEEQAKPADFKPFAVYKDKGYPNRFTPSGYMPNGECLYMNDAWTEKCTQGKSCIKVIYDVDCSKKGRNWAGRISST